MSNDDYLRKQAQNQFEQTPQMQNLQSYQANHHTVQTYNNELERLRREQDQKSR